MFNFKCDQEQVFCVATRHKSFLTRVFTPVSDRNENDLQQSHSANDEVVEER